MAGVRDRFPVSSWEFDIDRELGSGGAIESCGVLGDSISAWWKLNGLAEADLSMLETLFDHPLLAPIMAGTVFVEEASFDGVRCRSSRPNEGAVKPKGEEARAAGVRGWNTPSASWPSSFGPSLLVRL